MNTQEAMEYGRKNPYWVEPWYNRGPWYDPFSQDDDYVTLVGAGPTRKEIVGASASAGDFIPYVSGVGSLVSGLLGGGAKSAGDASGGNNQLATMMQMQMLQDERNRRDQADRNQKLLYVGLGIVGVGALIYLLKK